MTNESFESLIAKKPDYGRKRINMMLDSGLLKRDGVKGQIIRGPKLLYWLAAGVPMDCTPVPPVPLPYYYVITHPDVQSNNRGEPMLADLAQ